MSVIKQSCRYVCLFSSEIIWPTVENRLFRDGDNTQLATSISLFIKAPFIRILISFPLFYILYICVSSMISVSSFLYLMKSVFPAQKTKQVFAQFDGKLFWDRDFMTHVVCVFTLSRTSETIVPSIMHALVTNIFLHIILTNIQSFSFVSLCVSHNLT